MFQFVKVDDSTDVGVLTLNRPEVLNAWHAPMRAEIGNALRAFNSNDAVRAIVMTGAGEKAFSAGQDLKESKDFDPDRATQWIEEWRDMYGAIRDVDKPLIAALNGVAAGSAFQVALLADIRVGHPGVRMGQPEINAGIASTLGPWIMKEMLGLSRTVELTLTGRLMDGRECHHIGLIHYLASEEQVMPKALEVARELGAKPPIAMRLNKRRFREVTQAGFNEALEAGLRTQHESYRTGEPQAMMVRFLKARAERKSV